MATITPPQPVSSVRPVRRPGRTRRRAVAVGLGLFVVGLLLSAAGAGVAGYHLVKVGLTVPGVAGLFAVAGGLVLTAVGARGLWRATPRWWRLLLVPTLLALGVLVVVPLSQAVAATNVPPIALGAQTPADRGLAYRAVEFPAADGVRLAGWYVPSANGAAVVLLHGSGSTRTAVLDQAQVLAGHGYGVLLYDARGHGASQGRAMEFGWYGDEDVAGAVTFLQAQPDVDDERIAAVGMSMGGEQAIGAAAADGRIRAVVAEGATQRVAGDRAWLPQVYGLRGRLTAPVDWLTTAVTDLLTDARPPATLRAAASAMAPRPVLLVTAGRVADEGHAAAWIRAGSPDRVRVWTAARAAHTGALDAQPAGWARHVLGFLDTTLDVRQAGQS